jgi:hypothetical protein
MSIIWVALVCKRLAKVASTEDLPPGLDKLYKRMLIQISELDDADLCRSLLSVITTIFRPITLDGLASCVHLPKDVVGDYKAPAFNTLLAIHPSVERIQPGQ